VVSGDGDALSIGGNHLIHALRRNVPLKILLFNNQIYGSPRASTRRRARRARSRSRRRSARRTTRSTRSRWRSAPRRRSWRARSTPTRSTSPRRCAPAAAHQGTAFVEIYQNCNVFNDGAFDAVRAKGEKERNQIRLEHGKPIRFGEENERGVVQRSDGSLELVDVRGRGEEALVIHDPEHRDPSLAFALAQPRGAAHRADARGVFRSVSRPTYAQGLHEELEGRSRGGGRGGARGAARRPRIVG
jgi:2-oxoglutarate ferredoxin oxidoreductase subunit beta